MGNRIKQKNSSNSLAIIGLIGTILTVCGGISGALIGGATTLYKIERDAQKIAIEAPSSDQPLLVDTNKISINSSQAENLDPGQYMVSQDLGFVTAQPRTGWKDGGQMLYQDLFMEEATNLSPLILFSTWVKNAWNDQPVRQLRYIEPVIVQFIDGSSENGIPIDPSQLHHDKMAFFDQITILAISKTVAQQDYSLYGLALAWGGMHRGGVNKLVANPDSQYVFEQVSWKLKGVKVNDQLTDLTLQRWALFADSPERYFIVELQYVPAARQPAEVWEDLQAYLNAFRVIH